MKWKLTEDGNIVAQDGKPVYEDKGKEIAFDAPAAIEKIKTQAESIADLERELKDSTKDLEKELKAYQRLGEVADIRKKLQIVAGLEETDLDAAQLPGQIAELRAENETYRERLEEAESQVSTKTRELEDMALDNAFSNSRWIRDNMIDAFASEPRTVRKLFGDRYKVEGGKVLAIDGDGKPLLTVDPETNRARPASFDESMEMIVGSSFRKPSGAKGSDASSEGFAGGNGAHRTVKSKSDLKTVAEKTAYIKEHGSEAFQNLPLK